MSPYRDRPADRPSWWALMRARMDVLVHWWKGPTVPHWVPDIRCFEAEMARRMAHLEDIKERRG